MLASSLPAKFNIPFANSAGSSYIRPIPQASQIGVQDGAASLTDGFPPWCFVAPGEPFGQDYNGLFKQITQWNQWQQLGGAVPWDSTFSTAIGGYPKGAEVASAVSTGLYFYSTVDNNVTNPDAGGADWVAYSAVPNVGSTDTGTANAIITTVPTQYPSLAAMRGQTFTVTKAAVGNTAACTMSVNTFSGNLVRPDQSAVTTGDLPAACTFMVFCDGVKFLLQSPAGTAAYKDSTDPTQTSVIAAKGSFTVGHYIVAADTKGTGVDGGAIIPPVFVDSYQSPQEAFSNGSIVGPFSHGISGIPQLTTALLICTSADSGFTVGQSVRLPGSTGDDGSGCSIITTSSQISLAISSNGIELINPSTFARDTITPSKWKVILQAYS